MLLPENVFLPQAPEISLLRPAGRCRLEPAATGRPPAGGRRLPCSDGGAGAVGFLEFLEMLFRKGWDDVSTGRMAGENGAQDAQ